MKVETPLALEDMDDRHVFSDNEKVNQCTFCGVSPGDPWYPIEDVMVVRHWNIDSIDERGGGHWTWYCPEHFERRADNWWRSSHLAPAHLLPEERHLCSRAVGLGSLCGDSAVEPFDGAWLCETHAAAERVSRRIADLLSDDHDKPE